MNIPTLETFPMYGASTGAIRYGRLQNVSASYPQGMQYAGAGRLSPVGDWWADYADPFLKRLGGVAADIAKQLLSSALIKAKVQMGYKIIDVTTVGGKQVVKMTDLSGRTVYVDENGVETFATIETAAAERSLSTAAKAGIGAGVLAVAALAAFLLLRRK